MWKIEREFVWLLALEVSWHVKVGCCHLSSKAYSRTYRGARECVTFDLLVTRMLHLVYSISVSHTNTISKRLNSPIVRMSTIQLPYLRFPQIRLFGTGMAEHREVVKSSRSSCSNGPTAIATAKQWSTKESAPDIPLAVVCAFARD